MMRSLDSEVQPCLHEESHQGYRAAGSKNQETHRYTIRRYSEDPFKYANKLTDPRLGSYRFRIGDYRVIFDLDGNKIIVLRVGHRKDIYRRL